MARAQRQTDWPTQPAQARQEWNNLRDELETLLDQVHERQNQFPVQPAQSAAFSQGASTGRIPEQRRRDALRSVQRAVQRANEHEEATDMAAQSPERLQSAIEQIRASQNRSFQRATAPTRRAEPGGPNAVADLKVAIGEISERMSRFEALLEARDRPGSMVEEIAQQMEQLTSVVEMLANSVGEQTHIKRIEGQIARLAEAVDTGQDLDLNALSERLDVLSGAFDRLAVLQADQHIPEIPDYSHHLSALDSGVRLISDTLREQNIEAVEAGVGRVSDKLDAMDFSAVEACVRSVYDRIDTLENNIAVPTPAIERLTRDLAEFTEALKNGKGPAVSSTLVTRVDALNARLSEIEDGGQPVDGLKYDMEELRQAVSSAIEPRFNAIETQLGSLSDQFGAPSPLDATSSISGLEDQIKRLADRLDKTGDELTQLQSLYSDAPQLPEMPDLAALADMVANRTQSALAETAMAKAPAGKISGLQADDLHALEQRLSQMFEAQRPDAPQQDLSSVERSLQSVNTRLQSLEEMLRSADRLPAAPVPSSGETNEASVDLADDADWDTAETNDEFNLTDLSYTEDAEQDDVDQRSSKRRKHPGLDESSAPQASAAKPSHLIDGLRDKMPRQPTDDAPLNAPAYPEPIASETNAERSRVPIPSALRAEDEEYAVVDNLSADEATSDNEFDVGGTGEGATGFDAADAGPPPPPRSDFAPAIEQPQIHKTGKLPADRDDAGAASGTKPVENVYTGSRSTFIAAARRAAQQNNPETISDTGAQSLFGRALARFQKKRESAAQDEAAGADVPPPETPEPETVNSPKPKTRFPRLGSEPGQIPVDELDDLAVRESALTKYRRPILLGAAVLAVSLLTLNLVSHRLNSGDRAATVVSANVVGEPADETAPPASDAVPAADAQPVNGADVPASDTDFPVGSIGEDEPAPPNEVRVIDPTPMAEMPAPLELASFTPDLAMNTPAPAGLPENLGPLGLRDAAENGDARAQFEAAAIFAEGRALPQDLAASARWYELSAAQGYAPAAYRLGNMYENGTGVETDMTKARFWYEKAAGYGNRMSMHNLASILASGALGEQKFAEAAVWFEKAAGLGLTDSQFNLGMLYARGLGVPQDLASSYKWFSIAAGAGDEDATQARDDIARSLDAETVSRLQAELTAWSPQQMNIPANFAPIGTWDDAFDPGPQIENSDIILRVQAALNKLGYDTGIPDGVIGPKTHDAVRAFEDATGMNQSGEVNPRLLAVLGSQPV